jgi:anaerobic magnesium-protoporphyrin IX monomethyl ester cyclase
VVLQLNEYAATRGYSKYNLVEPVIKSKNMTIEELGREPRKASQKFFMHK